MTKESAIELIKEVVSEVQRLPISEIDSSEGLESYGVDSITFAELVTKLEINFDRDFVPRDFLGASSIEKLADAIVKQRADS